MIAWHRPKAWQNHKQDLALVQNLMDRMAGEEYTIHDCLTVPSGAKVLAILNAYRTGGSAYVPIGTEYYRVLYTAEWQREDKVWQAESDGILIFQPEPEETWRANWQQRAEEQILDE